MEILIFTPNLSLSSLDVSHLVPPTKPPTTTPPNTTPPTTKHTTAETHETHETPPIITPAPSACDQVTCLNEGICVIDGTQKPVCRYVTYAIQATPCLLLTTATQIELFVLLHTAREIFEELFQNYSFYLPV